MARDTIITHEQVRKNQIKTVVLIILYVAIIITLSLSIGYYNNSIELGILIAGFIILILLPIQILTGKKSVGSNTKWHEIDTNDQKERDVLHLVEGLAIAAGLDNTPKVYIVPSDVPNAFAGGLTLKNSYIGVTRGLIDLLDRPEMEGVIAHEMSHIISWRKNHENGAHDRAFYEVFKKLCSCNCQKYELSYKKRAGISYGVPEK